MSIARLLFAICIFGGLAVTFAADAAACSCWRGDARRALQRADAAFIGILREKRLEPNYQAVFRFEVEEVIKGQLGRTLEVRSAADGAACGIETPLGGRTGLLLYHDGQSLRSSLCSQRSPGELRLAAGPLPRPDGIGPIAFVMSGVYGDARILSLDRRGRTLGYGLGGGTATSVAVCPRARKSVETVIGDADGVTRLAVRDVRTLRLLRQVVVSRNRNEQVGRPFCRDRDARSVFAFGNAYNPSRGRLLRVRGRQVSTLYRGSAEHATFRAGVAFLTGQETGLRAVNLTTGRIRTVDVRLRVLGTPGISVSGKRLAVYLSDEERLAVIDLSKRPIRVVRGPRELHTSIGELEWVGRDQFGLFPAGGDSDRVEIFDTAFRSLGTFRGWNATDTVVASGVAWGLGFGTLLKARLPGGPVTKVRTFFSPETYDLAHVPGAVRFRPQTLTTTCSRG